MKVSIGVALIATQLACLLSGTAMAYYMMINDVPISDTCDFLGKNRNWIEEFTGCPMTGLGMGLSSDCYGKGTFELPLSEIVRKKCAETPLTIHTSELVAAITDACKKLCDPASTIPPLPPGADPNPGKKDRCVQRCDRAEPVLDGYLAGMDSFRSVCKKRMSSAKQQIDEGHFNSVSALSKKVSEVLSAPIDKLTESPASSALAP